MVQRIMVDPRSAADLLYMPTLLQMGYQVTCLHNPCRMLTDFKGSQVESLGEFMLPVTVGPTIMFVTFSVLNELSSFNVILDRTWLHAMKAMPSTYHQTLSFLINQGQIDIRGDKKIACSYYTIGTRDDSKATK